MKHYTLFLLVTLLILPLPVFAQTGAQTASIHGVVHDQESGEELIGANVLIDGTTQGASTDLDGKYIIRNVGPGQYSIRVSYVGYTAKTVTGLSITPGASVQLDVNLSQDSYKTDEITITAERVIATDAAILADRKKASTIGDGISAEQVKRTPDATSGDALKRITGISVVDNKFVFIRGITDRYNQTTLDGASVASTESGKKGFSFDLVPANLLENMVVVKSATPDLPGDFSGGLVQINTLDFPDHPVIKVALSSSYNSRTTSGNILRSQGGAHDWLGSDDGIRSFPGSTGDMEALGKSLPNTWAPRVVKAPYNGSLSLALGGRMDFGEEGDKLGYIAALSYSNSFQRTEKTHYDPPAYGNLFTFGDDNEYSVLWGTLVNVSYKFSGLHKISFKNSFNRSAEDGVRAFQQNDSANGNETQIRIVSWSQRSVYTGQLTGEHMVPALGDLSIQWRASVSSSARQDPDRKESFYARPLGFTGRYRADSYSRRSWGALNDRVGTIENDFSLPLAGMKLKAGTHIEVRRYNYGIRYFNVGPGDFGLPDSIAKLPLESIYSPDNYGPGRVEFSEIANPNDSYEADSKLYAGYIMGDAPFEVAGARFRFTGGVRLENSEQNVVVPRSTEPGGLKDKNQLKRVDLLPSMNLTYIFNDIANLRLALSHSVNRPEFREIAPIGFFDYVRYENVQGNPGLQRSYIRNYDVRIELFPGVGEVFAVSYFSKIITSAIEERLVTTATRVRSLFNSDRASNRGVELEIRKSLGFLGGYCNNFLLNANWTRIRSDVTFVTDGGGTATRPMQGQSSYTINLSLQYTEPALGTSLTISYNKFGPRIESVGFQGSDVYEQPRDLVDLSLSQSIVYGLEGKFTIKNLTGKDIVLTRDGIPFETSSTGTTYAFQLAFAL